MTLKIQPPTFVACHTPRYRMWVATTEVGGAGYQQDRDDGECHWWGGGCFGDKPTLEFARAACIAAYEQAVREHPVFKLVVEE